MIRTEGLTFAYDGVRVLDGVDLEVRDGEWVVLAGPNGSGKTTLVRHFNALLEPDAGTVTVDGVDVTEDPVTARTRVGMTFQHAADGFVAPTVGEDVAFGPENLGLDREAVRERVREALDAVDLAGREDDRVGELSGGEQARLAIAGALAMHPDHLVLDEPFAGLDWPARRRVLSRLDDLSAAGTSVVVVTHDLRDVRERADRVVVLSEGRVVREGPPEAVADALRTHDVRVPPC